MSYHWQYVMARLESQRWQLRLWLRLRLPPRLRLLVRVPWLDLSEPQLSWLEREELRRRTAQRAQRRHTLTRGSLRQPLPPMRHTMVIRDRARPKDAARLLIKLTVLLLPTDHRNRWAEELVAELRELVLERATFCIQVLHAFRVLRRVPALRRAVRLEPCARPEAQ